MQDKNASTQAMINLLTQQFGSMPSNTKRKSKNLNKTTNFG